jgi:hypothetical protein
MGLRSVGGAVVELPSSCGGGGDWVEEDGMPSLDFGGGSDHTTDPVTGGPPLDPLARYLGAWVLMGYSCSLTWILVVSCGLHLGGESSTKNVTPPS